MALMRKKSPEELHAEAQRRQADDERRALEQQHKEWAAFSATPQGQARGAFERGDYVFQYSLDVMVQQAVIVVMIGSTTTKRTTDAVGVLNAVCSEGWELVNGLFVFVEEGSQSRDKFGSSGQTLILQPASADA